MADLNPQSRALLARAPYAGVIFLPDAGGPLTLPPCNSRDEVCANALRCPRPDGSECAVVDNVEGTILAIMRWHNGSTTIEEVR